MMDAELTPDELYKAAQTILVDKPDWGHRAVATAATRKALDAVGDWLTERVAYYLEEEGEYGDMYDAFRYVPHEYQEASALKQQPEAGGGNGWQLKPCRCI